MAEMLDTIFALLYYKNEVAEFFDTILAIGSFIFWACVIALGLIFLKGIAAALEDWNKRRELRTRVRQYWEERELEQALQHGGSLWAGKYTAWYVVRPFAIAVCAILLLWVLGDSFEELGGMLVISLVIATPIVLYRWVQRREKAERLEQARQEKAARQEEEKQQEALALRREAEMRDRLRQEEEARKDRELLREIEKRKRI